MITLSAGVALSLVLSARAAGNDQSMQILRTPDNVRFGLIGRRLSSPAPTLLVVAMSLEDMQREPVYTEVSRLLAAQGVLSVVVEPPCHGEDRLPDEPAGLAGWRHRLDHGSNVVASANARLHLVLDHVIAQRLADPACVAVCGTSRGGFLAFHFAAVEPRIKAVAGISPVTDLLALTEFAGCAADGPAGQLGLKNITPRLAGRPAWVSIGNNDRRVDTDRAIAFTRALVQAGVLQLNEQKPIIPVELVVAPSAGHTKIDHAHELLSAWLTKVLPVPPVSPQNRPLSEP